MQENNVRYRMWDIEFALKTDKQAVSLISASLIWLNSICNWQCLINLFPEQFLIANIYFY